MSIEQGFISKGSASTITVVDTVKDLSEAVRDSSLRLELKNDDSFDWPILAPAQGKWLFSSPRSSLVSLTLENLQEQTCWRLKSQIKLLANTA